MDNLPPVTDMSAELNLSILTRYYIYKETVYDIAEFYDITINTVRERLDALEVAFRDIPNTPREYDMNEMCNKQKSKFIYYIY